MDTPPRFDYPRCMGLSKSSRLQPAPAMIAAMLTSDATYDGVFFTAVRTTKIFCRPTCPAKKPRPENVEFFASADECLIAGYRPCKRCRPLATPHDTPAWIAKLLDEADADPRRAWSDAELRERQLAPVQLRRWCKANFGLTFHALVRARKVGAALGALRNGEAIDDAADAIGYASTSGFRDAVSRTVGVSAGQARRRMAITYTRLDTPLGPMVAAASANGLVMLEFVDRPILVRELDELRERYGLVPVPGQTPILQQTARELAEYFARTRRTFTVPLDVHGTPFQVRVWAGLCKIPYGTTCSYSQLASAIAHPKAQRAIGLANGQNRIAIIVPCHRVIGADGKLVGYGGGAARKQWLLSHESSRLFRDLARRRVASALAPSDGAQVPVIHPATRFPRGSSDPI